jgi:hypothetical protein
MLGRKPILISRADRRRPPSYAHGARAQHNPRSGQGVRTRGAQRKTTGLMRELNAIEITTAALEPGREQTLILGQPYPDTILLSHFETLALSPPSSAVTLTDLRIEQLYYLLAPVPLLLVQREQRHAQARLERQVREQLQRLVGSAPPHLLQRFKPSRRETRVIALDICWKPHQQLSVTIKNFGVAVVDKVSIELVLYAFDPPIPMAN